MPTLALGKLLVARPRGGAITILKLALATFGGTEKSETCAVKVYVPAVVGLPETTPELFRVSPGGTVPAATLKVKGCCPFTTPIEGIGYTIPTSPFGSDPVRIVKVPLG
jgi:hypothetical protein